MKKAPPKFVSRVKAKMDSENLGISDLARRIGVSHPTITELITYGNQPSFNTCVALSVWLGESPEMTVRAAGLLPPKVGGDEVADRGKYLLDNYKNPETKNRALEYLEFLQLQEERGEYVTKPASKPKKNEKNHEESLKKALGD